MKIVLAIDSFKGCLSSVDVERAAEKGIICYNPTIETIKVPISDGGEGWLNAISSSSDYIEYVSLRAHNPLMKLIDVQYIVLNKTTAVVEMAAVCGLSLIPFDQHNPMITTTYGLGEIIRDALDKGYKEFIIGIGGSATNDGGIGMLQALGYRFYSRENQPIGYGGQVLSIVDKVDTSNVHPSLKDAHFTIANDVNNPLYGPNGAAYIFAKQKGADDEMIKQLDKGLNHWSSFIYNATNRDVSSIPGSGAAGGTGSSFIAFFNYEFKSGISLLLDTIHFDEIVKDADMVITGEGCMDEQTLMGKAPYGILQKIKQRHIPVVAITGNIKNEKSLLEAGFTAVYCINTFNKYSEQVMNPQYASKRVFYTMRKILHS